MTTPTRPEPPGILTSGFFLGGGLWAYDQFSSHGQEALSYGAAFVAGVAGLKLCAAVGDFSKALWNTHKSTRRETRHAGSATLLTVKDAKARGFYKPRGDLIGMHEGRALFNRSIHSVLFAPPGTGKTIGPVINWTAGALVSGEYDIVIVVDPKPEIAPMMAPFCKRHGFGFHPLNPTGRFSEEMGPSAHLNQCDAVIWAAQNDQTKVIDYARELIGEYIKIADDKDDKNIWWKRGGVARVLLPMAYFALTVPDRCNWPSILAVAEDDGEYRSIVDHLSNDPSLLEGDLMRKALVIAQLELADFKNHATMMDEGASSLELFTQSGGLAKISRHTSFDLDAASKKTPMLITISCDATLGSQHASFITGSISALSRMVKMRNKRLKVKLIYDEASFAAMEPKKLNGYLNIWRGFGVSCDLFFQSPGDAKRVLEEKGYRSMMANCDRKIWCALEEETDLEEVSKAIGERGLLKETYRGDASENFGVHRQHERRRILTPQEIRTLPKGMALMQSKGAPFALFEMLNYAQVHPFSKQIGKSPWHDKQLKAQKRVRIEW